MKQKSDPIKTTQITKTKDKTLGGIYK